MIMKRAIILTLIITIFSNCEIKFNSAKASDNFYLPVSRTEVHCGMTYRVWYTPDGTSQTGYGIYVVNLTKDALEIQLLEKQLKRK
jgi:hypothetical protein